MIIDLTDQERDWIITQINRDIDDWSLVPEYRELILGLREKLKGEEREQETESR